MKNEENTEKNLPQQHISEIVNNPKIGLISSIYSFFSESFGGLAYNPNLKEENVPKSPDLPDVDLTNLYISSNKLVPVFLKNIFKFESKILKTMNNNHKIIPENLKPDLSPQSEFYQKISPEFFAEPSKMDPKLLSKFLNGNPEHLIIVFYKVKMPEKVT